jgi:hypothetical protein
VVLITIGLMRQWHQVLPSPFQPGSGMGPGMMSSHDWADMGHQYGHDLNDHWLVAMIHNRSAELALCPAELRAGASAQARHMAQAMLTGRPSLPSFSAGTTRWTTPPATPGTTGTETRFARAPGQRSSWHDAHFLGAA